MDCANYSTFEQRLIKNENLSFIKMLIERDIKNYKYNISNENVVDYINRIENKQLHSAIEKYNITDSDLKQIQSSIMKTSKYNLEVEYLPTEDWEFDINTPLKKEFIVAIPTYEMLSNALALFILLFPFAALFLSYFLIMIFR
ncbi:MAG: hypothetical protein HFI87_06210 [Bacilli bacterium]|nr:hypothetical protein [Bacilli bacterium]